MLKCASTRRVSVLLVMFVVASYGDSIRLAYGQQSDAKPLANYIDLSEKNYTAWRDHILPKPSELGWRQIPWLSTFKDGILAAHDAGKPLLFWTMNGHPLGCT